MLRRKRGLREVEENNLEIKQEIVRQEKGSKLLLLMSRYSLVYGRAENIRLLQATAASIVLCRHPPPPQHVLKWRLCPPADS